ncbi:hypothetical protein R3P38DRAFT_3183111 [Favolaschia claudopus]|uniref:Uncharacterized protein n=1 Tax=Favolaschia claudopus TaxID=2862362 RepID=A0AAW0CGR9_9AGAR
MDPNFNSSGGRAGQPQAGASQLPHHGVHPADSFQNGYYGAGTGSNSTDNSFYNWNMQPNGLPGLLASALHNDLLYINGTYTTLFQAYNTMKEKYGNTREAQAIRATQTSIYREIQRVSPADLPKTWGSASLTIITYHRAQMYKATRFSASATIIGRSNVSLRRQKAAAVTLRRDGCTCVCTCSRDSPSQSNNNDDDDDDPISRSTSGSTSASSSTSASGPTSISPKSSVASSRPTRKRKISTVFIPSTQPQKRRITSHDPDADMLDSLESDPAASTRAPGADQTLVNITNTAPSATLSAAGGAAPTPIAPIPSTTPSTPSNDSIPLSPLLTVSTPPAASTPPTVFAPSSVSFSNNAPSTVPEVTPAAHSTVVVPAKTALVLVNPLNIVFGAPVGPPARSEGLKAASTSVAGPSTSKKAKKRVNKDSLSPASLFYQDYLKTHDAVTSQEFDQIFADLSEEERLKWTRLSTERNKAKKAAKQSAAGAATTISQTQNETRLKRFDHAIKRIPLQQFFAHESRPKRRPFEWK